MVALKRRYRCPGRRQCDCTHPQLVSESFQQLAGLSAQVSRVGLVPPLGVLIVQPSDHLVRFTSINSDHDLVAGLGGLAGEDVENGPAVRMVHPKRVAVAIFRVLLVLARHRPVQACTMKNTAASTTTVHRATPSFETRLAL